MAAAGVCARPLQASPSSPSPASSATSSFCCHSGRPARRTRPCSSSAHAAFGDRHGLDEGARFLSATSARKGRAAAPEAAHSRHDVAADLARAGRSDRVQAKPALMHAFGEARRASRSKICTITRDADLTAAAPPPVLRQWQWEEALDLCAARTRFLPSRSGRDRAQRRPLLPPCRTGALALLQVRPTLARGMRCLPDSPADLEGRQSHARCRQVAALASGGGVPPAPPPNHGGGGGGGRDDGGAESRKTNPFALLLAGWRERVAYDAEFPVKVALEQVRARSAVLRKPEPTKCGGRARKAQGRKGSVHPPPQARGGGDGCHSSQACRDSARHTCAGGRSTAHAPRYPLSPRCVAGDWRGRLHRRRHELAAKLGARRAGPRLCHARRGQHHEPQRHVALGPDGRGGRRRGGRRQLRGPPGRRRLPAHLGRAK